MQHIVKSTVWYLKNLETKSINYLNVGEFKIGRCSKANPSLDVKVNSMFCSKLHCTFEYRLDKGTVWLHNKVSYVSYFTKILKQKEKYVGLFVKVVVFLSK